MIAFVTDSLENDKKRFSQKSFRTKRTYCQYLIDHLWFGLALRNAKKIYFTTLVIIVL